VLIFLDSNIVIYLIEQAPRWGRRAAQRLSAVRGGDDRIVLSDLVRMECRVGPLTAGDHATLAAFDSFFVSSEVDVTGITAAVCDRAAEIRAQYGFRPLDALHLSAAVEAGCEIFLTTDARLDSFSDLAVEVLC